jgi:hypothetical protein
MMPDSEDRFETLRDHCAASLVTAAALWRSLVGRPHL